MNKNPRWVRVARCQDIPLREGRAVRLGSREIAIFNLGERFLAVANLCPHRSGPLADGMVAGGMVVCPLHAWKVDLETGQVVHPSDTTACIETFRVRVQEGSVLMELAIESPGESHPAGDCAAPSEPSPALNPSRETAYAS